VRELSNLPYSLCDKSRDTLQADCANCFGLCCVALPFAASADFAVDKAGGKPCSNLQEDFRCRIHTNLREKGFRGCAVYECFGAGQKISQITFAGKDWRDNPETAKDMFEAFPIMQQLHEMLWYLTEALSRKETVTIHSDLQKSIEKTEELTFLPTGSLMELDIPVLRAEVNTLLLRTSELVRVEAIQKNRKSNGRQKTYGRGTDFIGANLRKKDLSGANLRGALLIAADLREADLRYSDVIGADFRDANLSGADLTGSIFLTQDQLNAAKGNLRTKLPQDLKHPSHWLH